MRTDGSAGNKPFRLAEHVRHDLLKLRLDLLKFVLAKNDHLKIVFKFFPE